SMVGMGCCSFRWEKVLHWRPAAAQANITSVTTIGSRRLRPIQRRLSPIPLARRPLPRRLVPRPLKRPLPRPLLLVRPAQPALPGLLAARPDTDLLLAPQA